MPYTESFPDNRLVVPRKEAMERLVVTLEHYEHLVADGHLVAEQHGKRWYVTVASLEALAARWRGEPTSDGPTAA